MDLRAGIRKAALARPAVLMAVCPGATEARLQLERELRERGWPLAAGPAAANVLAVVGDPDPADSQWCEGLWAAIPAPGPASASAPARTPAQHSTRLRPRCCALRPARRRSTYPQHPRATAMTSTVRTAAAGTRATTCTAGTRATTWGWMSPGYRWRTGVTTGTGCGWTSSTFRWGPPCWTGLPAWSCA
ncbi:hypothetical protein NKH18_06700 [Streptomyces sp. M10(2022)]